MNFLFDNPLANMSGPIFLTLYGLIICFSAIAFYLFKSRLDWTSGQPVPLIPNTPDPYEIAYLRGGINEFARSLVFSLVQKGFLQVFNDGRKSHVALAKNQPNWTTLSQLEREALKWFQVTRRTSEIFEPFGLVEKLQPFSMIYEQKINQEHLLKPKDVKANTKIFGFLIFGAIAVLGGYKLVASIMHGRYNILFLIAFTAIALVAFWFLGKTKRLSERGKKYLENLQSVFEKLRENPTGTTQNSPVFNAVDPLLLAMGLYGKGVLVGNGFTDFDTAFNKANKDKEAASATSCSSGCGASCSGGSSGIFGDSGGSCSGSSCSGGSSCGGGCGGGCGGS